MQSPLALTIPELWDATHRVVGAHSVCNGVCENAPAEPQRARCCAFSTAYPSQATAAGFYITGGLPSGHSIAQISNVGGGDGGNGKAAKHRLDVARDATFVDGKR